MNDEEILARAAELVARHGLFAWKVRFDNARRRAGCCYYDEQVISLSRVLLKNYPPDVVDEVILHEIAHALVGANHGHDQTWKRVAKRIGATPKARLDSGLVAPPAPWQGKCERCGATRGLYRTPRRVVSCGVCSREFRLDYVLAWTHEGDPAEPAGAYAKELAQLRRAASR